MQRDERAFRIVLSGQVIDEECLEAIPAHGCGVRISIVGEPNNTFGESQVVLAWRTIKVLRSRASERAGEGEGKTCKQRKRVHDSQP
ncbi:hypothetical protein [Mesorhizobium sp. M0701]|uniref:hypothetical protein n=1 Tax=Mesorhizobium sp. M0701 TaxID=2956989 RepID=UPI0033379260